MKVGRGPHGALALCVRARARCSAWLNAVAAALLSCARMQKNCSPVNSCPAPHYPLPSACLPLSHLEHLLLGHQAAVNVNLAKLHARRKAGAGGAQEWCRTRAAGAAGQPGQGQQGRDRTSETAPRPCACTPCTNQLWCRCPRRSLTTQHTMHAALPPASPHLALGCCAMHIYRCIRFDASARAALHPIWCNPTPIHTHTHADTHARPRAHAHTYTPRSR